MESRSRPRSRGRAPRQASRANSLAEGDFILKLNLRRYQKREAGAKFLPCWEGPYILNTLHDNGSATILDAASYAQLPRLSAQHLR